MEDRPLTVVGLMSGTSLDGIDAAIIETDGERVIRLGPTHFVPYTPSQAAQFRALIDQALDHGRAAVETDAARAAERELTLAQTQAVKALLSEHGLTPSDIDLVGFHGQTIMHQPHHRWTWQLGDGALMAAELGVPVVNDFRGADVAAGGEGAPFAPLYHAVRLRDAGLADQAVAVLNLGGVGNVTYGAGDTVIAFDTGPANALMNDWMLRHTGAAYDADGKTAAGGTVDQTRLKQALDNPYFVRPYPKSLDRTDFDCAFVDGLSLEDGAATLTAFTVGSVVRAVELLPSIPDRWFVCGGGRKNPFMMSQLSSNLKKPVEPVEALGWRGDYLEAEAFGLLAVRSVRGLPLSLPTTTGVPEPLSGGVLHRAA